MVEDFKIGNLKAYSEKNSSVLIEYSDREEWYKLDDRVNTYVKNHISTLRGKKVNIGINDSKVSFLSDKLKQEGTKPVKLIPAEDNRQKLIIAQSAQHDAVELVKALISKTDIKNIEKAVELVIYTRDLLFKDLTEKYNK